MKKTMTIKQIDNSAAMLKNLQGLRKHWPVKVNYAIAKNLKTLLGEVDIFVTQRTEVIQNNMLKDENGNAVMDGDSYQFPEGKEQEVVKDTSMNNGFDVYGRHICM